MRSGGTCNTVNTDASANANASGAVSSSSNCNRVLTHALKSPYGNEYDAETGRAGLLKRDSYYHTWGQGTGIN